MLQKTLHLLMLGALAALLLGSAVQAAGDKTTLSADQALQNLKEGNQRFLKANFQKAKGGAGMCTPVAKGQKPFAVIVGCSDSRVPPELIFDQGLGDLFIIRLAGNIVDDAAAGSIEYAVDHLGVPLVVVLGHKRCGAVDATVKGGEAHGHIPTLVKAIKPAVEMTRGKPGDPVDNAVRANAENMANKLEGNAIIKKAKAKVIQGYYDLDTGLVTFWSKR